jgi:phosphatidylglycerophosphatase A
VTLARLIASGFGSGLAPKAPGTAGSLAAVLIGAALMWLSPAALPLAVLLASLGGLWAVSAARVDGDPGWVVIDEFAGMWIAMLGLARPTAIGLIAAFLLFRLLDIVKPGPVGWADRQKGAAGIMADDIIAGAIAAGILWAVRSRFPGLLDGELR